MNIIAAVSAHCVCVGRRLCTWHVLAVKIRYLYLYLYLRPGYLYCTCTWGSGYLIHHWRTHLTFPESLAYIFVAACMGLSSFKFVQRAPKDAPECVLAAQRRSRSSKVNDFGTNRKLDLYVCCY